VKITVKELHNLNSSLKISRMVRIGEGEKEGAYMTYVRDQKI
jgi:fructose-1,6-bisphosphatase/sedoheptulose 1,7-bisphosphatase-like protein